MLSLPLCKAVKILKQTSTFGAATSVRCQSNCLCLIGRPPGWRPGWRRGNRFAPDKQSLHRNSCIKQAFVLVTILLLKSNIHSPITRMRDDLHLDISRCKQQIYSWVSKSGCRKYSHTFMDYCRCTFCTNVHYSYITRSTSYYSYITRSTRTSPNGCWIFLSVLVTRALVERHVLRASSWCSVIMAQIEDDGRI